GRIAIVGYYPGMQVNKWLPNCDHVDLIDQFQIHVPSADPLVEADRSVLRALWDGETRGLDNLYQLGPHGTTALAKIPPRSIDTIYFPGENSPHCLVSYL